MDPNALQQQQQQQQQLLRAIAISSLHLPSFTAQDRQQAYVILEDFKKYDGRIPICIGWLHSLTHVYNQEHDITIATKLLALEIFSAFLVKGYSALNESDRLAFRQAVLKASQMAVSSASSASSLSSSFLSFTAGGTRILARKLAAILEGIMIRDFPQRWTTFMNEVFVSHQQGGLWYDQPGPTSGRDVGIKICLECLKLAAEDCTDSDFNAKISTTRRNDVLTGLNEVSNHFLPLLFQLLEHYPLLQQAKQTLHNMHTYLASQNRTIHSMTAEESSMYQQELALVEELSVMIADTLVTLHRFCCSMPLNWITGGPSSSSSSTISISGISGSESNSANNTSNTPDFVVPLLYLLRESEAEIQVLAVHCLEQLVLRGKLSFTRWVGLLTELPSAIQEANQAFATTQEHRKARIVANGDQEEPPDALTSQLGFHRALSRLMSHVLSSYISHITSSKQILEQKGNHYDKFAAFVRVLVDLLHHPSGRICTEQINTWTALLRDPQMTKTGLLQPFIGEVVSCYTDQMVKVRWEDVENQVHPYTQLMEASFDDEDEYDNWVSDFRSRASLLFKFSGNTEPQITCQVLNARVQSLLTRYGNGEPRDYLDPSNGQLTQKSEAVMQFEGICQPLENAMSGIPSWALDEQASSAGRDNRVQIRAGTRAVLAELAKSLVGWDPTHIWLKFRRASLLDSLKYFWQYDPSTLLPAIDSLIRYLGLSDEWRPNQAQSGPTKLSGEIVGLKKKSGVTLVSVSRKVPHHLVPWLTQLSNATNALLSSSGLIPTNQMHLYEFLSCIATAVDDPIARSNFIGNVLSSAVETLESRPVQQCISSVTAFLEALGVAQAGSNPASVTDSENVKRVTGNYNRIFTALNQLLSVGRRCHEATRKKRMPVSVTSLFGQGMGQQNFPDEGPLSINDLAVNDPFVPLWHRILPILLQIMEVTLGVWRPENQASLLTNSYQRYVFAISEDEAFLSKTHDARSGGVFGEGGTAGSVVAGASRRDINLVPKWSGWFSELRNTCFQMMGLLAMQRVLFAPEIASLYPRVVSVLTDTTNIRSMENRQFIQFQKHVLEILMVSCPAPLYKTHLEPILGPIFEHIRYRMEKTWLPILSAPGLSGSFSEPTRALTSAECNNAAALALRGGEEYFSWFYAHCGLFVGDLDSVTAEAAVEKSRVELSRTFSDMMQVTLALKGDWALVLANQAKEEQALKKNDSSRLVSGPLTRLSDEGVQLNADGTPKRDDQASIDARKLLRINGLCHFLLLESETIAGNLTVTVVQCLGYPDAYTCRRITKICHRILETVAWSPQYAQLLGQHMLTQAVKNIVIEPKWMVGIEWDMINVVRDIYCRLVLGQTFQFGGQGAGQQQVSIAPNDSSYEQAKAADQPLQGGGILTVPSDVARQVLVSLPGSSAALVLELEKKLKSKRSAKDQKDSIRDFLRMVADQISEMSPTAVAGGAAAGIFDRAVQEESLLHSHTRSKAVPDLPEKLVLHSHVMKSKAKAEDEPQNLSLSLFDS